MLALMARVGALAVVCVAVMSAAAPFTPLPDTDPLYGHIQHYSAAGLLGEAKPWTPNMTRLEAAVLIKRAIAAYGEARVSNQPADTQVEQDLQADITAFAAELSLLGLENAPTLAAAQPQPEIPLMLDPPAPAGDKCAVPEPAPATPPSCDNPTHDGACTPAEPDKPTIKFTPYGDVALQLHAGRTAIATGGTLDMSDISVYFGEIGVDGAYDRLGAHASVLLNTNQGSIDLHEAYVTYNNTDGEWNARMGRILLPPGSRATIFPTAPAAVNLAYTRGDAIGAQLGKADANVSAYLFNPDVDQAGKNDTLSDFALGMHKAGPNNNDCRGYDLNATMTSNIGASDLRIAGPGPLHKRVGGANLWGSLHWNGKANQALAEYTWSFSQFAAADLDANGDGRGDRPAAFDAEYIHTSPAGEEWGVSYQQTSQMVDTAEKRYTLMSGRKLNDISTLRLELSRGTFGDYTTNQAKHDMQFVAEVRVVF